MHYMMHIVHYSAWWRSVEGDRVCPYRSWCKGSDREDLPLCFVLFTLAIAISHSTPLDKLTVTAEREGHRCSLLATLHDTFDPPFQSFSLYLPMRVPAWHRGKQPVPYTLSRRGAVAHWLTVVCLENSTGCASSLLRVMRCDICSGMAATLRLMSRKRTRSPIFFLRLSNSTANRTSSLPMPASTHAPEHSAKNTKARCYKGKCQSNFIRKFSTKKLNDTPPPNASVWDSNTRLKIGHGICSARILT